MKKIIFYIFLLLVTAITLTIFFFSLQDAPTSNALSTQITSRIMPIIKTLLIDIKALSFLPLDPHTLLRELAHITEFFILAFCMILTLHFTRLTSRQCAYLTLLYTVLISILDELIQRYFSSGRAFQFIDLAKDWLGMSLAIFSFMILRSCYLMLLSKFFHK